jgi:SAM-dependent methyltransferase
MINITTKNKAAYQSRGVVAWITDKYSTGLTFQEQFCFERIPAVARGSILDIGIGGGRTIGPLSSLFESYVGIDYSAELVEVARRRYPARDIRVMDASRIDLPKRFDVVCFSFNGIDGVDQNKRATILSEMYRLTKVGGYVMYSTHNLDHHRVPDWMHSRWVSELFTSWRTIRFIPSRLRNFSSKIPAGADGIAFVNDPGLGFRFTFAYVDISLELRRLDAMGFEIELTIGNTKTSASYDANDCWVYILARKVSDRLVKQPVF